MDEGKFIYKELSYILIGLLYKIFNSIGYGYREKYYERALARELQKHRLCYKTQLIVPLTYDGEVIGKYVIDFVVDRKIAVELKVANTFRMKDIQQILSYLKANELKLGILVLITKGGVRYRRIINTVK